MAERLAYLEAVVGADITEFRKSMRDIRNDVGILSETISGIGGAARTMTFAFTAPMVALGTYAVTAASGFDASMRNINSILGLSEDKFAGLENQVMSFAKTTRAGVVPATDALYEIFSAGITDQTRAMAVWQTSNKVAEAGNADLVQTTNAVTATMSAYNLQTTEAAHVGNVWTQMVKQGVGSLGDFLSNSQKILPLSSAMNISLEDMGSTLAFLSQGGGGAAKAETSYAMMLSNMMKPTTAMTDALHKLGVQTGSQLVAKFGSVANAVMALKKATDETTFNKMFSKTGLEAALRITGNIEGMTQATKDFNDGLDTATMDAWTQQSKSFSFQWDLMKTSLEAVAIMIGQQIIPLITPMVQGFSQFMQKVSDTNPQLVQLGVIFVGVIAAAAPLIWLLTSLLNPIGLIVAGVTVLGTAFATNFDGIRDKVLSVVAQVTGGLAPLKDAVKTFMDTLFPTQKDFKDPPGGKPVIDFMDHITVTKPMTLWEVYKSQGYDKQFTWTQFMKDARAGGWAGGEVKVGDMIKLTGGDAQGSGVGLAVANAYDGKLKEEGAKADVALAPPTMFGRMQAAVAAAWPKMETALNTMWSNFTVWVTGTALPAVDHAGGDVLNHIAGWFDASKATGIGDSKAYDTVTKIMTANVGGAATDAAATFEQTFPQLTGGLRNLFNNVANWIEVEGVPTLARSIGFIAGRLASMLRDGIGMMWQQVGGGSGLQKSGQAVTQTLDSAVFKPLSEGVQAGIGKNDGNIFDTFMDNLGAALLLAATVWVLAPSVITAIAKPVISAVGSAMVSALASSQIGAAITTFVGGLGITITTALGALSILGIGAIIIAALLSNEDVANGLKAWAGVWDNAKLIIADWADATAVKLRDAQHDIEDFFDRAAITVAKAKLLINPNDVDASLTITNLTTKINVNNLNRQLEDSVNGYLKGMPVNLNISGLVPTISGNFGDEAATAMAAAITDPNGLIKALQMAVTNKDSDAMYLLLPITIAYEAKQHTGMSTFQEMKNLIDTTGMDVDTIKSFMVDYYHSNPVKVDEIDAAAEKFKVTPSSTATVDMTAITSGNWLHDTGMGAGTAPATTMTIPVNATPVVTATADAAKAWADAIVPTLPAAVMASVQANGGDMTASANSMTAPFITAFTGAFAPGGSVSVVWDKFLSDYVIDLGTMLVSTNTNAPLIQAKLVTAFDAVKNSTMKANEELTKMAGTLNGLVLHSPYKVEVDMTTNGSTPTLPAGAQGSDGHHAVGLDSVPFDGYRAVLHQGEMVLNKGAADDYRSGAAVPKTQPSVNVDQSSPTFIANGIQDFDAFLREAKRRGYNLDKYRR